MFSPFFENDSFSGGFVWRVGSPGGVFALVSFPRVSHHQETTRRFTQPPLEGFQPYFYESFNSFLLLIQYLRCIIQYLP